MLVGSIKYTYEIEWLAFYDSRWVEEGNLSKPSLYLDVLWVKMSERINFKKGYCLRH